MPKARTMPREDVVLAALKRSNGWVTDGQVADRLHDHAPNVARVLRKLAGKGLVEFSEHRYRYKGDGTWKN